MIRKLFAVATALVAVGVAAPNGAAAQNTATVTLMHGVPGATVDVIVDGEVVIPGFEPGTMQDLSAFAGQTLTNVEVRAAGTDDAVIGPIAELPVPSTGNWTVVAHLQADGAPTLTPFENDTSQLAAGQGRLTVRHTAAAPAVDVVLADGSRPFTNLTNPDEAAADLPAGEISGAGIAPAGGESIADVPTVTLAAGSNLIVYAVGSVEDETFTFLTQEITGLGGAPTAVNTGDAIDSGADWALLLTVGAGALALAGGGAVLAGRRARR